MKYIGIIVVFNPDDATISNINHNISILGNCVVVDNSNHSHGDKFNYIGDKYIFLGKNMGIGYALNVGIERAMKFDAEWYITLDQDSTLGNDFLNIATGLIEDVNREAVAIISPVHVKNGKYIESDLTGQKLQKVETVMMSGNLVSAKAYNIIGKFNEELFIDYVDIEYCLRANLWGLGVYISPKLTILHNLGQSTWYSFGNFILKPTNHNKLRRYYITRNRIILFKNYLIKFSKFFIIDILRAIKETFFIFLFESDKISKITYMIRGMKDAFLKKTGEFR